VGSADELIKKLGRLRSEREKALAALEAAKARIEVLRGELVLKYGEDWEERYAAALKVVNDWEEAAVV